MGRPRTPQARRRARHAARHQHWTHALAAQPWITLVLLAALLVGGLGLLRADRWAAEATLTTPGARASSEAAVRLSSPALVGEVEEAVELSDDLRGELRLEVVEDDDPVRVVLRATAGDPRLAALAADTALALVVEQRPDAGYELTEAAVVPTDPVQPRSLWWTWVTLVALAIAIWVELNHRTWLRDHPAAVAEGAR